MDRNEFNLLFGKFLEIEIGKSDFRGNQMKEQKDKLNESPEQIVKSVQNQETNVLTQILNKE